MDHEVQRWAPMTDNNFRGAPTQTYLESMMTDILRSLRLGIINILGITVPGLIVLFYVAIGFLAPCILLIRDLTTATIGPLPSGVPRLPPIGTVDPAAGTAVVLLVAYIIGYVFRLSTPDDLDERSATWAVRKKMNGVAGATEDAWPFRMEDGNKFPYFHFREYLEKRNHKDFARLVDWDEDEHKRSKTSVNRLKLETHARSPRLSALIESNEAHIRMLFGAWLAVRLCRGLLVIGFTCSTIGFVRSIVLADPRHLLFAYSAWMVVTSAIVIGAWLSARHIERLFHYRRVRELFDVVACAYFAREGFDLAGNPMSVKSHDRACQDHREHRE